MHELSPDLRILLYNCGLVLFEYEVVCACPVTYVHVMWCVYIVTHVYVVCHVTCIVCLCVCCVVYVYIMAYVYLVCHVTCVVYMYVL